MTNIDGKKRLKMNLHCHTSRSDGRVSENEALKIYSDAGYDAIAITDHWMYHPSSTYHGMQIVSGCEYSIYGDDPDDGSEVFFHIVGIGMDRDPDIPISLEDDPNICVYDRASIVCRMIQAVGGFALLAHPAWSLNTTEQVRKVGVFDGMEIYNSVSGFGSSSRPYSGLIADMLANQRIFYPVLAVDDTHFYAGDQCCAMIMIEEDAIKTMGLGDALRNRRFFSTQGPEIHLDYCGRGKVHLHCSPCKRITFLSNIRYRADSVIYGEHLTEADYTLKPEDGEFYVRAEVLDHNGQYAWSNLVIPPE